MFNKEGAFKNKKQTVHVKAFPSLVYMPEILPVHNGNNHWRNLIFKDNGVGSQGSLINPFSTQTFQCSIKCWLSPALITSRPVTWHQISPKQDMGGGRWKGGGTKQNKKRTSPSNNQGQSKAKRQEQQKHLLLCCFSFHNILHQRWLHFKNGGKGAVSCRWHRLAKPPQGAAHRGKGLQKGLLTVPLWEQWVPQRSSDVP